MKSFVARGKNYFILGFQYKAWVFTELITGLVGLVVSFSFWTAISANNSTTGFETSSDLITYVIISGIVALLINSTVIQTLGYWVTSGQIATILIKPYSIFNELASYNLSYFIFALFIPGIPLYLFSVFVLGINTPDTFIVALQFTLACLLGFVAVFAYSCAFALLVIFLHNQWGIVMLDRFLRLFLTGALVPLSLFPMWFQNVSEFLPYQYFVYQPVLIYTSSNVMSFLNIILMQLLWIAILTFITYLIWTFSAKKKIVVFGG